MIEDKNISQQEFKSEGGMKMPELQQVGVLELIKAPVVIGKM